MYEDEIERELGGCKSFRGVFMADTIPRNISNELLPLQKKRRRRRNGEHLGWGIIINLDESNKPGSHWVAFWLNNDQTGEYFDSFGSPPPTNVSQALIKLAPTQIVYSKNSLQHEQSSSCGLYCIFFIKHKCLKLPFTHILSHFSRSQGLNEIIVNALNPICK